MKEHVNGKEFGEWLTARVGEEGIARAKRLNDAFARRLSTWRNDPKATTTIYKVDEILVRCFEDIALWEIPEHIYRDEARPRPRLDERTKRLAMDLLEQGWTPTEVAVEFGIEATTVPKLRKQMAA